MYYLIKLCCTCLSDDKQLSNLKTLDANIVAYYYRLSKIPRMHPKDKLYQKFICEECLKKLQNSYKFWRQCLRSKTILNRYFSRFNTDKFDVQKQVFVELKDICTEKYQIDFVTIFVKDELGNALIKSENSIIKNKCTHVSSQNSVKVDKEPVKEVKNEVKDEKLVEQNLTVEVKNNEDVIKNNKKRKILKKNGHVDIKKHKTDIQRLVKENNKKTQKFVEKERKRKSKVDPPKIVPKECDNQPIEKTIEKDKSRDKHICKVCKKEYEKRSYLANHMRRHNTNVFRCKICNKKFVSEARLAKHREIHTEKTSLKCQFCSKVFEQRFDFLTHMKQHSGEKPHFCELCDQRFSQKSTLKIHLLRHTGQRPYCCKLCNKRFLNNTDLGQHQQEQHTKRFKCNICGKEFEGKYSLKMHLMEHSEIKKFKCKECDKKYMTKQTLQVHMKVHAKERNVVCKLCGYRFNDEGSLKKHMRVHLEKKPKKNGDTNKVKSEEVAGINTEDADIFTLDESILEDIGANLYVFDDGGEATLPIQDEYFGLDEDITDKNIFTGNPFISYGSQVDNLGIAHTGNSIHGLNGQIQSTDVPLMIPDIEKHIRIHNIEQQLRTTSEKSALESKPVENSIGNDFEEDMRILKDIEEHIIANDTHNDGELQKQSLGSQPVKDQIINDIEKNLIDDYKKTFDGQIKKHAPVNGLVDSEHAAFTESGRTEKYTKKLSVHTPNDFVIPLETPIDTKNQLHSKGGCTLNIAGNVSLPDSENDTSAEKSLISKASLTLNHTANAAASSHNISIDPNYTPEASGAPNQAINNSTQPTDTTKEIATTSEDISYFYEIQKALSEMFGEEMLYEEEVTTTSTT